MANHAEDANVVAGHANLPAVIAASFLAWIADSLACSAEQNGLKHDKVKLRHALVSGQKTAIVTGLSQVGKEKSIVQAF